MENCKDTPIKLEINRGKLTKDVVEELHSRLLSKLASLDDDPVSAEVHSKSGFSKNGFAKSTFSKSRG